MQTKPTTQSEPAEGQLCLSDDELKVWPLLETLGFTPILLTMSKYAQFREDLARASGDAGEASYWEDAGSQIDDLIPWVGPPITAWAKSSHVEPEEE